MKIIRTQIIYVFHTFVLQIQYYVRQYHTSVLRNVYNCFIHVYTVPRKVK